jgi:hypothetical protein
LFIFEPQIAVDLRRQRRNFSTRGSAERDAMRLRIGS